MPQTEEDPIIEQLSALKAFWTASFLSQEKVHSILHSKSV